MSNLTDRQMEILRYIARTTEERGFPPTIREIGGEFNIRSTNGVNDHLKALQRKGYLDRGEQKSRALVPTRSARMAMGLGPTHGSRGIEIPVVGRVAAGAPILAEENLDDSLCIDPAVLPQEGKDVFALKVKGDSMIGDGIFNGDIVFVRQQPTARPGEIVVAMISGEATVKRYYPEGDRIRLQPSNPSLQPIYIERAQAGEASIVGIVVGVFRKLPS